MTHFNQGNFPVHRGDKLQAGADSSNPQLIDAVRAIRQGRSELITEFDQKKIEACITLLRTRIDAGEIAGIEDFKICLGQNRDRTASYYAMAVSYSPDDPNHPISIACGSLTPTGTLIIGYAATSLEYAGAGLGRAVVNLLIENANRESRERHGREIQMIALEASKESPRFWGGKIGCKSVVLVSEAGAELPFHYIQPPCFWDADTGEPKAAELSSSIPLEIQGQTIYFPGVEERFMVKLTDGTPLTGGAIINAVTDFLDNYYFIRSREDFNSTTAFERYQAFRSAIISYYQAQLATASELKLV